MGEPDSRRDDGGETRPLGVAGTGRAAPVGALTAGVRPLDPALRPRRAYIGDAAYNATFLGTNGTVIATCIALGAPLLPSLCVGLLVAGAVTWLVDRVALAQRASLRFNVASIPGGEAMARGRYDDAERIYAGLAKRFRARSGLQAVALFNQALVRSRRGQLDDAEAMLRAIDAFKRARRQPTIAMQVPRVLAELCAQRGRTTEARAWLADARGRRVSGKAYDAHVEATILAREGRFADAAVTYEREWIDLERVVSQLGMNELRVRRAFALSHVPARNVDVDKLLAAVQPARDDELAHVGLGWPELSSFLRARGLVRG